MLELVSPDALALAIGVACFAIFAIGAWLGSRFPDIDLQFKAFLPHRSIVTHGCAIPALLFVGTILTELEWARLFVAGFSAGVGLHLAFDLFPQNWKGLALIYVPKVGFWSRTLSVVWLFAGVFVCVWISVSLGPELGGTSIIACVAMLFALYFYGVWKKKEHYAAGFLLALLAMGADAFSTFSTNGK